MAELGGKSRKGTAKALALSVGLGLAVGGTAAALPCSDPMTNDWLPARTNIVNPAPADRQAIMDLIHSYNWALDDKNVSRFTALFTPNAQYEACTGAGNVQVFRQKAKRTWEHSWRVFSMTSVTIGKPGTSRATHSFTLRIRIR